MAIHTPAKVRHSRTCVSSVCEVGIREGEQGTPAASQVGSTLGQSGSEWSLGRYGYRRNSLATGIHDENTFNAPTTEEEQEWKRI